MLETCLLLSLRQNKKHFMQERDLSDAAVCMEVYVCSKIVDFIKDILLLDTGMD